MTCSPRFMKPKRDSYMERIPQNPPKENNSDLTFRGYLAGTTPVISARSFLFVVQVLFVAREDRVAYWWDFRPHHLCFRGVD